MFVNVRERFRWAFGHFVVSALIMLPLAAMILVVWYPHPYRVLSGGVSLFLMLAAVDIVLGPVCTFCVASPGKPRRTLRLDVATIALVQVAALSYGVWTAFQARPVYLAFEIDRLRVVHAADVDPTLLASADPAFRSLPVTGPGLVAVRPFVSNAEKMEVTLAALQGVDIGARADLWVTYASQEQAIRHAAKPVQALLADTPSGNIEVLTALNSINLAPAEARYLPVASRYGFWTAILSPQDVRPIVFLPIDPFD